MASKLYAIVHRYFNTSYVKVTVVALEQYTGLEGYFNTSYVKVTEHGGYAIHNPPNISIHRM